MKGLRFSGDRSQFVGQTRPIVPSRGDREELINALLRYLRVLNDGDEYVTVTVPEFWSDGNLGLNGRFLTMNKMMALRGVAIRRVFLLCESDRKDALTLRILKEHLRVLGEVEAEGVETQDKAIPSRHPKSFYTGYVLVDEQERDSLTKSGNHVAIWRKAKSNKLMSLTFSTTPDGNRSGDLNRIGKDSKIGKVRFWASPRQQPLLDEFKARIAQSHPLADFLADHGLRHMG
jgi:hypothetical protein